MISKDGPSTLFCGGCRKAFPAKELTLVKKLDVLMCEDCRK